MTTAPIVTPRPVTDLTSILGAFELMGVEYDHIGNLWVAAAMADESAAVFVSNNRIEVKFRGKLPITHVQPLPDNELLLVEVRCRPDLSSLATIVDLGGQITRQFSLGGDITAVQAKSDGSIWVAYGDMRHGMLSPGLIKYDAFGRELESYLRPAENLPEILECYAVNVAGEESVWLYYYEFPHAEKFCVNDHPLLRLAGGVVTNAWSSPVFGSRHIAIWQDYVVYCQPIEAGDSIFLCKMVETPDLRVTASFRLRENDTIVAARGSQICIANGKRLYQLTVQELVTQFELLAPVGQIGRGDDTAAVNVVGGHRQQVARYGVIVLVVVLVILLIIAASGQPGPGNNDDIVPTATLGN